ncbi:SAC3/GANP domain-containing protein [Microsporum canis CBS 113480]|uniref:SAC3/GANP domain-containing protein n=1 Tax=Arthroderma otae (strain ATCC MYA-4605 / CBS 113480) TaxID=554155 RepID=C5FG51_ARTOC|nr:SAC3/GANP domain-containing protein [Microsporum canis CBS 113480]EEQ29736.1 SAC3/GANP domain-containing protein [Microsporum canis CBS 113480]
MNTAASWRASASATTTTTATTAYTPVQARRTLARNSSSQAAPSSTTAGTAAAAAGTPTEMRKRVEWPPAVRDYVQRSFVPEQQIPGITRADMEAKLKQVITGAAETNHLGAIDWASLPLPQQMIQNERNTALLSISKTSPKRKSTDISTEYATTAATNRTYEETPPWRSNGANGSEDKRRRLENDSKISSSKFNHNLESRKRRFESTSSPTKVKSPSAYNVTPHHDPSEGPIVGRSTALEKRYLRLTAAPNPDNVRPLPVLRKSLDLLKKRWKQENNYGYICDQFKSMRQDLTVQHIKNDFTVLVYEIHARIALEKGDLGEYNQCQTQLQGLYALNLGGHPMEFKAYRILYFIYTRNQTAINSALSDLTPAEKADPAVSHALAVRSALALGNYHRFFQLYLDTPNMGAYLMDMFVDRERLSALACICKAYKPEVNIRFITEELGFESDEQSARFVLDHVPEHLLQEKADGVKLLTGKCGAAFEQAKLAAHRVIDIKGQI